MRLIFVCSGNTCRSPLAMAAWSVVGREMSGDCQRKLAQIRVESAGLNARAGTPATSMAQLIAAGWDADLSEHRARAWRLELRPELRAERPAKWGAKKRPAEAQLIVTMTAEQAAQVRFQLEMRPHSAEISVEILGAFVADTQREKAPSWSEDAGLTALDIPDPYGGSSEAYEECAARILRAVRALARALCRDEMGRVDR